MNYANLKYFGHQWEEEIDELVKKLFNIKK